MIINLIDLRELWINDNPLREFPTEMRSLTKLTKIDAHNTQISYFQKDFAKLEKLTNINFDNCPLNTKL